MSVYVGIDVHRKRSQVAVVTEDGVVQVNRNVPNGVEPILGLIGDLPTGTPVAFEAAYGWGWLVELLEDYGFAPHLVHPLRCKAIASARLKNDKVDAATLAQLLRADLLPEAWIAPPQVRQLRALLRHRVALVRLCTGLRNQIHAVTADHGFDRPRRCVDRRLLDGPRTTLARRMALPAVSRQVITDNLAVIDAIAPTIDQLNREVHARAKADPRVAVLTALPGVGEFTVMVLLAEIGDIGRFSNARRLASWAGLTPTVRGSDLAVHHGHIWKAGLAIRAVGACAGGADRQAAPQFAATYQRIANRRGPKIATVAVARKLLTRAYHLLADTDTHPEATGTTTTNNSTCVTRAQRAYAPTGRVTKPRARSPQRHEPATSRARSFD